MGTSASNAGPKGKTPLLPNWVNDKPNTDIEDIPSTDKPKPDQDKIAVKDDSISSQTNSWNSAKTAIKKYTNDKTKQNLKKSGRSYVKTYGGFKSAARASARGIDYGYTFASFLGGFVQKGYEQNLKQYGLDDCIGKSSEEVLAKIADKIAPIGSTNDDAIARAAIMDTLDTLYEKIISNDEDIDSLGSLSEDGLKEAVIEYTSNYIYKKWVYELGLALEKNNLSEKAVIRLENEIRTFIKSEVLLALKDKDIKVLDLAAGEGKKIIQNIFELAYQTIEK